MWYVHVAQIAADEQVTLKAPKKYSKRQRAKERDHASAKGFVDEGMSAKILAEVKAQQDEVDAEERAKARAAAAAAGRMVVARDSSDEEDEGEDGGAGDAEEKWVRMEDLDIVGASAEDEATMRFFLSDAPQQRQSLGEMILQQIQANVRRRAHRCRQRAQRRGLTPDALALLCCRKKSKGCQRNRTWNRSWTRVSWRCTRRSAPS